jgi:hypothetical protein
MEWLQHPAVTGAIAGVLVATKQDWDSFRGFQSFQQFAAYSWGLFAWRVAQGAVIGAASVYGIGAL